MASADPGAASRRALVLDPADASAWTRLGNALDAAAAQPHYRAAARLEPERAEALYNLARALRAGGLPSMADDAYRRALVLQPAYAEALNNRANLLRDAGREEEAALAYLRALAVMPQWELAHGNLADLLGDLHDRNETATVVRFAHRWRRDHAEHPVARHIGAALAGEQTETRAGDGYIRREFDRFADTFETTLAGLGYRAPVSLAALAARIGITPKSDLDVLDAGCGTGLCAPLLRPLARRLTGVDLSAAMLARARTRHLYDDLAEANLDDFLARHPGAFDLAVAADVLCYFGDLGVVVGDFAGALRAGGALLFSVEALDEDPTGYRLLPHGRFAHGERYLRNVLENAGLSVMELDRDTVRLEAGIPVTAYIVAAVRPGPSVTVRRRRRRLRP